MTPIDSKSIAKIRMDALNAIRVFFVGRDYVEIEAPLIVQSPDSEPTLTPFATEIKVPGSINLEAALITSPEYSMKKLLGLGHEKIFSLGKVFRNNEVWDKTHVPEFTMLEWYEAGVDYRAGMTQTEELIHVIAGALGIKEHVLLRPWVFKRVETLFEEYLQIEKIGEKSLDDLKNEARLRSIHTDGSDNWSDVFYRLYVMEIEPKLPLDVATIIYDYPLPQAALARTCADGIYAERFELFCGNLELCNAFTELTNAGEQRKRFEKERDTSALLGKQIFPIDEELLRLLPSVPNPTFGNAVGVDRLLMALLGVKDIQDVLLLSPQKLFGN
jgi:lysyl-tRNA synthetase class 2